MTFDDLTAWVADWLHRTDLATVIPRFITLAETRMYQGSAGVSPLRLTTMETQVQGTTSAGIGTLTDLIEIRKIVVGDGVHARALDYADRATITNLQRTTGFPTAYSIEAGMLVIGPVPSGDLPYSITYFKKFPALSASQQSNWLLDNAPSVYLYGALLESMPYIRDDARTTLWMQAYADAVATLQASDDRLRSAGGALKMRAG